jgi:probable HAF family extracellular repeat protein
MQDLGTLPGTDTSEAYAVNEAGHVVGASGTHIAQTNGIDPGTSRAFLWQASTGLQDLGFLPGAKDAVAYAINSRDQVVGQSGSHAFVWRAGIGMRDLGTLPGGTESVARAINDEGQIVGSSTTATGQTHAVLWQPVAGTPPTTTAIVAPLPNAAGWEHGTATVTLSTTAASGGVPVQSLTYSATGAQAIGSTTVQGSTASIAITTEGITTLSYFATDQAGNQEQAKTLVVRIDTTPPEAVIQFDPTRQDLLVFGKDAGSGVPPGPIAPSSTAPTSWNSDDRAVDAKPEGNDRSAELRPYTLTDLAGNTTTLVLKVQVPGPHGHQLKARLVSIQYGSTPAVTFGSNSEEFHWDLAKDGTLSKLDQQVRIGTGHDQQAADAHYEAGQGRTDIRVKNPRPQPAIQKPGLDLLQIVTAKGQLSVSY